MLEFKHHILNPPLWPSVQVTKLPTTFFMFLRVPLTHLDRWLAFFTKFPRDYGSSQTIMAKYTDDITYSVPLGPTSVSDSASEEVKYICIKVKNLMKLNLSKTKEEQPCPLLNKLLPLNVCYIWGL